MDKIKEHLVELALEIFNTQNIVINKYFIILLIELLINSTILLLIWKVLKFIYFKAISFTLKNNISTFINYSEIAGAVKYYINTRGQNISPTNENEPSNSTAFAASVKLIPKFLKDILIKNNEQKYYIVLADSGMGKSTFLINLLVKYRRNITIRRKYKIKLIPLGHPSADEEIKSLEHEIQENTILLLDAFDEDVKASHNYSKRIEELVKMTFRYKFVILTCRTQFFASEQEEPFITKLYKFSSTKENYHKFKKIYISPFSKKDIRKYLFKKYPIWKIWNFKKRRKALKLVLLCPNLMVRPMLLSNIDELIASKNQNIKSASDAYHSLIQFWIQREANRIHPNAQLEFKKNMYQFSLLLSKDLFINYQHRGGLFVNSEEILEIAKNFKINLSELELKGKSLLTRDNEGKFKFAHKSIFEFLLASYAIEDNNFAEGVQFFNGLDEFDQARNFYSELDHSKGFNIINTVYDLNRKSYQIVRQIVDTFEMYSIQNFRTNNKWFKTKEEALADLFKEKGEILGFLITSHLKLHSKYRNQQSYFQIYFLIEIGESGEFYLCDFWGIRKSSTHRKIEYVIKEAEKSTGLLYEDKLGKEY